MPITDAAAIARLEANFLARTGEALPSDSKDALEDLVKAILDTIKQDGVVTFVDPQTGPNTGTIT